MNQTGGDFTKKQGQTQMEMNPYAEEPRPNLYNVVKNIRDSKVGYMRVLYAAKINESELKGDVEGSMNNHFRQLQEEFGGLKVLLGALTIVLLEGDKQTLLRVLKAIHTNMQGTTPFYNQAWVLHFVDEAPNKVFNQWLCKTVAIGGAGREIKSLATQMEKQWVIYEAMSEIGRQLSLKGITTQTHQPSQIAQFVKSMANESLPVSDELLSACTDQEMGLGEFLQFLGEPPDILLEKELVWPVEPDLMY